MSKRLDIAAKMDISAIAWGKLWAICPIVKEDPGKFDEWIIKAEELSLSDLEEEIKEERPDLDLVMSMSKSLDINVQEGPEAKVRHLGARGRGTKLASLMGLATMIPPAQEGNQANHNSGSRYYTSQHDDKRRHILFLFTHLDLIILQPRLCCKGQPKHRVLIPL